MLALPWQRAFKEMISKLNEGGKKKKRLNAHARRSSTFLKYKQRKDSFPHQFTCYMGTIRLLVKVHHQSRTEWESASRGASGDGRAVVNKWKTTMNKHKKGILRCLRGQIHWRELLKNLPTDSQFAVMGRVTTRISLLTLLQVPHEEKSQREGWRAWHDVTRV